MQQLILEVANSRVVVDGPALLTFSTYRQTGSAAREACGIVLGREWDDTLEITEATPPQKSDRRQRAGYVRMPAGHLSLARQRWNSSAGLIGYLGEWHSHPEVEAYPSVLDLQSSRELARRNGCRILSFIIGLRTSYAYLAGMDGLIGGARFVLPPAVDLPNLSKK